MVLYDRFVKKTNPARMKPKAFKNTGNTASPTLGSSMALGTNSGEQTRKRKAVDKIKQFSTLELNQRAGKLLTIGCESIEFPHRFEKRQGGKSFVTRPKV
eukprot:Stramenopile-MAST_4_protein_6542